MSLNRCYGIIPMVFFCLMLSTTGLAQADQCGTVHFNKNQNQAKFEQWIGAKIAQKKGRQLKTQDEEIYTIPVVVHVIHRGEAEGEGANIPYEQIEDQIRILNEDFRRQNADTVNTPEDFLPVAADSRIEFILAQQTTNGDATNGVIRVQGPQNSYGTNSATVLSETSYWDADQYLNIWVAPLSSSLLGYAQFPVSDLEGLEEASNNAQTDGVVVDYRYFGSVGNVASGSQGRTATHEIGHFLGLRHIWGDGDCSVDDYVEDTPNQESETNGCPTERTSCGNLNMFQNYMDYTNDVCMNIFTEEQKLRMRTVLENSERRLSLLTSSALLSPTPVSNDASITQIITPQSRECESTIIPVLEVHNAGSNAINSLTIRMSLQGNMVEEVPFAINLPTDSSAILSFSSLSLSASQANNPYELTFSITEVNGGADERASNNNREISFVIPQHEVLPLRENFEELTVPFLTKGWVDNPDELTGWEYTTAPGYSGEENQAYYLNFFNYENTGERDYLYTPVFSTENLSGAKLHFRLAYAPYTENNGPFQSVVSEDGLIVGVSLDCGATLDTILYEQYGEELATEPAINDAFFPENRTQWREEVLSLDAYLGEPNVQVVFIGLNDYGNNLFLDDVIILGPEKKPLDLALARFNLSNKYANEQLQPSYLSCNTTTVPQVMVLNLGSSPVNSFEVSYQIDELAANSFTYNAFTLEPSQALSLSFEESELATGLHNLSVQVSAPNLGVDDQPINNRMERNFYVDHQQDIVPLVLDFQQAPIPDVLSGEVPTSLTDWLVVNPDSSISWETVEVPGEEEGNMGAQILLNEYKAMKQVDRLVSPTLNLTDVYALSLRFDVSYAVYSEQFVDTLRVLVSTDCGEYYEIAEEFAGTEIALAETQEAWIPQGANDWQEKFVDLSTYTGSSTIRVAFEVVNGYGNNMYLDNVEFFLAGEDVIRPEENTFIIAPNPVVSKQLNAAFNLREREDVAITLYDMQGKLIYQGIFPHTLNQTYTIDMQGIPTGAYILHVLSPALNDHQKFILN